MTDLRELERASIRRFLVSCAEHLTGRVLDYGCGVGPYVDVVTDAGGEWHGFDRTAFPANVSRQDVGDSDPLHRQWDAIVCTQVVQYVPALPALLEAFGDALHERSGALVLTYPTCWPVVEPEDLWRFTPAGMRLMVEDAGLRVSRSEIRETVSVHGVAMPLGGGLVAHA